MLAGQLTLNLDLTSRPKDMNFELTSEVLRGVARVNLFNRQFGPRFSVSCYTHEFRIDKGRIMGGVARVLFNRNFDRSAIDSGSRFSVSYDRHEF